MIHVIVRARAARERTAEAEDRADQHKQKGSPFHVGISNARTTLPDATAPSFSGRTISTLACASA